MLRMIRELIVNLQIIGYTQQFSVSWKMTSFIRSTFIRKLIGNTKVVLLIVSKTAISEV